MKLVIMFARRNNHLINYERGKKLPTTYAYDSCCLAEQELFIEKHLPLLGMFVTRIQYPRWPLTCH